MLNINNDCCGCKSCGDICKQGAISYAVNSEGFWYPIIDHKKCNNCYACEKACPVLNIKKLKTNEFNYPECHAMVHKNLEIRFKSSSGGAFSALAQQMYNQGGFVGGAKWSQDWMVEHFISSNKNDLELLRSSKYLQSDSQGFYKSVKQLLLQGKKVLVCGTPCQMAALRAFLRKSYDNLIIVDFICHGINSPKAWKKYIESQEKRFGAQVINIKTRSTEFGWRNSTTKLVFANGKVLYDTDDKCAFMKGFITYNAYCRPSCYNCKFKGFPRISDITIADFWGAEEFVTKEFDNDLGTSVVMINNYKGKKYFECITSDILEATISMKSVLKYNPSLIDSVVSNIADRNKFFNDLDKMSFFDIASKYFKIKFSLKSILKHRVLNFVNFCKDIICASNFSFRTLWLNIWYNLFSSAVKTNILKSRGYIVFHKHCTVDIHRQASIILHAPLIIGNKIIKNSKLESRMLVEKNAKLIVDNYFSFAYGANIEIFSGALLYIHGNGYTNINSTIICGDHIEIGNGVICERDVSIRDNNGGHYIALDGYELTKPVNIGQHVWICEKCSIMQGVTIGDGSVVGAHTLVRSNVPSFSLVAGNPMKVIESNIQWKS